MKKLSPSRLNDEENVSDIEKALKTCKSRDSFVEQVKNCWSQMNIEFYECIRNCMEYIGFPKVMCIRNGDVNCRFDAAIISDQSIPIEIKSPGEDEEINIKAIRQAFENKIVLLSRHFFDTEKNVTSLAVAMEYPPPRSDVYELIVNIKDSFGFNVGIIDLNDLLKMVFDVNVKKKSLNKKYFNSLCGKLDYEKTFCE